MIRKKDILKLTVQIRKEMGYDCENLPKIISVNYEEESNRAYILCGDRSDKAVLMGAGGRIIVNLAKRLGLNIIIVKAYTDILQRKERIFQAIEAGKRILKKIKIKEITDFIEKRLLIIAKKELMNPLKIRIDKEEHIDINVIIAYSGGVDSTASLIFAKYLGANVIPITIYPGPFIIPKETKEKIIKFTEMNKLNVKFVKPNMDFKDIVSDSMNGRYSPCKKCHSRIVQTVYEEAKREDVKIIFFGDLLPTGSHSLRIIDKMLRVNFPAFLALSKNDTIVISKLHGLKIDKLRYGCPLFRVIAKRNKHIKLAAYQRILRETRAGVLEPSQGLKLIKSVERL